jgi:hypothetical protein
LWSVSVIFPDGNDGGSELAVKLVGFCTVLFAEIVGGGGAEETRGAAAVSSPTAGAAFCSAGDGGGDSVGMDRYHQKQVLNHQDKFVEQQQDSFH